MKSKVLKILSVFRVKNLQDTGIDNVFSWENPSRKMYTIFSAVQRQQSKSDVMTYFGLTACSAVYYQVVLLFLKSFHVWVSYINKFKFSQVSKYLQSLKGQSRLCTCKVHSQ
jgi:hypothetical protein